MLVPFWRDTPFTHDEQQLVDELLAGHADAARRQNISTEVMKAAYVGSGNFNQAIAAAICTLGGMHAPIIQAYEVLKRENGRGIYIGEGNKVAGWGNSFIKGQRDTIWDDVVSALGVANPDLAWLIEEDTKLLHDLGKNIYPNAACYTAATAITIGMPKEISPVLVHYGRVLAWAEILYREGRPST
jgi:citrate synthase